MTSGHRREPDISRIELGMRMVEDSFFRLSSSLDDLRHTIDRYNRKMLNRVNSMDDEK